MALILNGTDGLSDVDGTAATPAIRGTDTNTGIFFPAADTIAFAEGGTEVARFDSSGNLGIGTSSPSTYANGQAPAAVVGTGNNFATIQGRTDGPSGATNGVSYGVSYSTNPINGARVWMGSQGGAGQRGMLAFFTKDLDDNTTQPLERMRIDSGGRLCINKTSGDVTNTVLEVNGIANAVCSSWRIGTNGFKVMQFNNQSNSEAGQITINASSVSYGTSSDYRLKENIAPMTGALDVVAQLKPVTYNWKLDGSSGQGFIAHELQAVVPDCVTGEKDAVNEDGSIKAQGIDTSFLVATLTAAIQELKTELDSVKAELTALKGAA